MATSDFYIQDNSDIEDKKLEAAKGLYQNGNLMLSDSYCGS